MSLAVISRLNALDSGDQAGCCRTFLEDDTDWLKLLPQTPICPGQYTRSLICRTPEYEILFMRWSAYSQSPIHNHDGHWGAIKVIKGRLLENTYQPSEQGLQLVQEGAELREGEKASFMQDHIHTLTNPDNFETISIHLYTPPILRCDYYRSQSAKAEDYTTKLDCILKI